MQNFLTSGDLKDVFLMVAITLPLVVGFGGYYWWRARRDEMLINLKREMVAQGMSAEEIQMVILAGLHTPDETEHLKRDMLDRKMSPDQIEKVLTAGEKCR